MSHSRYPCPTRAALSVKWTAAGFVVLPLLVDGVDCLHRRLSLRHWQRNASVVLSTAFVVYAASFYVHFALLPLSGKGDAFMSKAFQAELIGNKYAGDDSLPRLNFLEKFLELNAEMYRTNQRMRDHPYHFPE